MDIEEEAAPPPPETHVEAPWNSDHHSVPPAEAIKGDPLQPQQDLDTFELSSVNETITLAAPLTNAVMDIDYSGHLNVPDETPMVCLWGLQVVFIHVLTHIHSPALVVVVLMPCILAPSSLAVDLSFFFTINASW